MNALRVVLVSFESAQILDITGPLEVFSTATRYVTGVSYETVVASVGGGMVASSSGLAIATVDLADCGTPLDTVIVVGGRDMADVTADQQLLREVQRLAGCARRVASVCSGAFVLAAAGLLDGRRAATHWRECDLLQQAYPGVTVDSDAIYVRDGNVWTSAGVTAGIDLALALVAEDHGRHAAARVARQLVVYLRRSGGQAQFSTVLEAQDAETEPIRDLLAWLPDHLTDDLTVSALARRMHLSARQFSRVFRSDTGVTAADYIETIRTETACRMLETTQAPIEEIARRCGFGHPETMNRTFRRRLGTTPGNHRQHFGGLG
ncbi:MAG TPA: GlxA family transcriptional regulator [Microlunatus sp.]|nr:GlxA family transcriptional regulator [Microlunatus sp.]